MLWTNSTREVRVSLRDSTQLTHIDLAELVDHDRDRSKRELVRLIEHQQEDFVYELCGPKYSRGNSYGKGGSYTKRPHYRPRGDQVRVE